MKVTLRFKLASGPTPDWVDVEYEDEILANIKERAAVLVSSGFWDFDPKSKNEVFYGPSGILAVEILLK